MSAMARELVEKAGVGESADAIWRQLDREHSKHIDHVAQVSHISEDVEPQESAMMPPASADIHLAPQVTQKKRKQASSSTYLAELLACTLYSGLFSTI